MKAANSELLIRKSVCYGISRGEHVLIFLSGSFPSVFAGLGDFWSVSGCVITFHHQINFKTDDYEV